MTDIHEDVEGLEWALKWPGREGVDRIVCLGDVSEDGHRIAETCDRLAAAEALCVWGNHDYGLCTSPSEKLEPYFPRRTISYMRTFASQQWVADCSFSHIEPCLDVDDMGDLWQLPDDFGSPERLAWSGETPISTAGRSRFLLVIAAVQDGHCAWLDTATGELRPFDRSRER